MAFRYEMTDVDQDRLIRRIKEAEERGYKQYGKIYPMGHKAIVERKVDGIKKSHSMAFTAGKYGVVMEKVEVTA